jgi:hypothetical protein
MMRSARLTSQNESVGGGSATSAKAVFLFACARLSPPGGLRAATEIQVFTRNAKPLARTPTPVYYAQPHGVFDPTSLKIAQGKLYAGADYADSVYAVFRWERNRIRGSPSRRGVRASYSNGQEGKAETRCSPGPIPGRPTSRRRG